MASFITGELITAEKLNQIANGKGTIDSGRIYNQTVTYYYYMSANGFFRLTMYAYSGVPINGNGYHHVEIYKLMNGAWTRVVDWDHTFKAGSSAYSNTWNISSIGGAGYYYITYTNENTAWWNVHSDGNVQIWPYFNNCVRGDYLVYYQPNSANPVSGTSLTPSILNSGFVGTRNIL